MSPKACLEISRGLVFSELINKGTWTLVNGEWRGFGEFEILLNMLETQQKLNVLIGDYCIYVLERFKL